MTILTMLLTSCNMSDYSSTLSGGYIYVNEGEGLNQILPNSRKIKGIKYVKKYCDNGKYLCAWQADTVLFQSKKFLYGNYKKNTHYPNDLFYIIDIKKEHLLGPYKKQEFLRKSKNLGIKVHWLPEP